MPIIYTMLELLTWVVFSSHALLFNNVKKRNKIWGIKVLMRLMKRLNQEKQ